MEAALLELPAVKIMQLDEYPFVQEFLTDVQGQICKVVLQLEDYQRLLEALEDEGLYQAMQAVRHEMPISRSAALQELENDEG